MRLRVAPALTRTEGPGGTAISSPVRGFRPSRPARWTRSKDTNPGIVTLSPPVDATASCTISSKLRSVRSTSTLATPERSAIFATRSDFVMLPPRAQALATEEGTRCARPAAP